MTELARPAKLQSWTYQKPTVRPDRSNSAASSPQSIRSGTFEIAPDSFEELDEVYQTRYLSSEEDLSSEEADMAESLLDFDEDEDFVQYEEATAIPVRITSMHVSKPKFGELAQLICIVGAARPTLVDVPRTPTQKSERHSDSDSQYATRFSMFTSSSSRSSDRQSVSSIESSTQRPHEFSHLSSESSAEDSDPQTYTQRRPSVWTATYHDHETKRNSMFVAPPPRPLSTFPMTPVTPGKQSFLNTDPYSEKSRSSASPIQRSSSTAHKRLRSISRSLALAKVAISKKSDKVQSTGAPLTPVTPMSAVMPQAQNNKRRLVARDAREQRASSAMTADLLDFLDHEPALPQQTRPKLIARGAAARSAVPFEQPSYASSESSFDERSSKPRNLRRRKSLLGLR